LKRCDGIILPLAKPALFLDFSAPFRQMQPVRAAALAALLI
jgi:hypothetical protein